ncbi:MAG: type II toxin-antitoxin system PemK/MazF family toxin [Armatimonadetes bacterium]|nr:type II toxin-antitoxin system PemK/MazF family toxin [Armatimonadota bacterium]
MRRGELYRVLRPSRDDPRKKRVVVIVSREALIRSSFSSVICAPVYSAHDDLTTQVPVGIPEGLKCESSIHCDELISIRKSALTDYVGMLGLEKLGMLQTALLHALQLEEE